MAIQVICSIVGSMIKELCPGLEMSTDFFDQCVVYDKENWVCATTFRSMSYEQPTKIGEPGRRINFGFIEDCVKTAQLSLRKRAKKVVIHKPDRLAGVLRAHGKDGQKKHKRAPAWLLPGK
jgi:hypothetical protein